MMDNDDLVTSREIGFDEAEEIARRLINSHFRQEPCARASIPANKDYDDDLLILAFIAQQRAKNKWLPLQTAPKTKTTILAWGEFNSEPVAVRWDEYRHGWIAIWDAREVVENPRWDESDFVTTHKHVDPITHWQPLPEPPK